MKYTLLDLTQTILSSLDGDEVDSISDTVESLQVATIIRTTYYDILTRANFPRHKDLVSLTPSGDSALPVLMTVDEDEVDLIEWIKYDIADIDATQSNFVLLQYIPLDEFLNRSNRLNQEEDNVETMDLTAGSTTYTIAFTNDKGPSYYTTTDDLQIIFDSYDSEVDTTLQASKTQCYARKSIPFTLTDAFTPDLDEAQFALLLHEAKSLAWAELKQTPHPKAERSARRGWVSLERNKKNITGLSDFDQLPNFGRK